MFLRIENVGIAPVEGFTLIGASTSRGTDKIGQFGSGSKHGVATLLRHRLNPIVFRGLDRMDFGCRPQDVGGKEFSRVFVKHNNTVEENLGFVVEFGELDWPTPDMALREFVSNALDYGGGVKGVKIEIVSEATAKSGVTRVFIPCTEVVRDFHANLSRWFMHFAEPDSINQVVLRKTRRNIENESSACIYRRGVRVREIKGVPSLFDYNLNELKVDEARKVDDYSVAFFAAKALADADASIVSLFLRSFVSGQKYWEHGFSEYSLKSLNTNWVAAERATFDSKTVLCRRTSADSVARKGYTPVMVPDNIVNVLEYSGVRTAATVLTDDEREGRIIVDAHPDAIKAVETVWKWIDTSNKPMPVIKCFRMDMCGGARTLGYYRDGTVFINLDLVPGCCTELLATALEECIHYVTGATDCSRDFQEYLIKMVVQCHGKGE